LDVSHVHEQVLWLSLLNAVACTALPVLLVMMAIERIGPGLTAQTGMIGPMSTLLMGVWILGEPFNAWIIAGTALVLSGVFWVTRPVGRTT
jgi:drug/metabolite transporter (DMT)-like permease